MCEEIIFLFYTLLIRVLKLKNSSIMKQNSWNFKFFFKSFNNLNILKF